MTADVWRADAACTGVGPELFFDPTPATVRRAKALCARCPVRDECAEIARTNDEQHGIWGGATELERYLGTCEPERIGRRPGLTDRQLAALCRNADPAEPAVEMVRRRVAVSTATAHRYVARLGALGLVERRGRSMFPLRASSN